MIIEYMGQGAQKYDPDPIRMTATPKPIRRTATAQPVVTPIPSQVMIDPEEKRIYVIPGSDDKETLKAKTQAALAEEVAEGRITIDEAEMMYNDTKEMFRTGFDKWAWPVGIAAGAWALLQGIL